MREFIAKQFSFQSRLGSILDPMADKILLASSIFKIKKIFKKNFNNYTFSNKYNI